MGVRAAAGDLGAGVDEQPVGYGRQHSVLLVRHGEPDPQIRRSELAGAIDGADGEAATELVIYGADRAQGTQVIAELPIGRKRTVSIS